MLKCGHVKIHVEVPTLLLFFAYTLATSVTTNLIIFRTCYVTLDFNKSACALLGTNYTDDATSDLEKKVQPNATLVFIGLAVIEAIIPPVLCFFLGPWSDKYGRKPLLLSTIGGCVLSFVVITIISSMPNASPWFFLLFLVPMCLSGGVPALITAVLCYISDVTSEEYRGVRIAVFEAVIAIGTILGTSSSSFILDSGGYVTIYMICTLCVLMAWLYTLFFIPESVHNIESEGKFRNLFKSSLGGETLKITLRRRENYGRALLLSLVVLMVIAVFASFGDAGVIFLYLRQRFHWTLERFTIFSSISNVTAIIGALIGVCLLHKLLQVGETMVILIGFLSALIGSLLQGLGRASWVIYLAAGSRCLSSAISPMARSLLSKLVPVEDSGKIFALVTAIESVSALMGTVVYTLIYYNTLPTLPTAFNFITAGLNVVDVILIIVIIALQRYQKNHVTYGPISDDSSYIFVDA